MVSGMCAEKFDSRFVRIPVRVHLGESERDPREFNAVLGEINRIWSAQGRICFVFSVVDHEVPADHGFDLWFSPSAEGYNGFFAGPHDIRVRDIPDLKPVLNPARDPAARTAAHELGHALGLEHRQNTDENLMRSKTFGWQLSPEEISKARDRAIMMEDAELTSNACKE